MRSGTTEEVTSARNARPAASYFGRHARNFALNAGSGRESEAREILEADWRSDPRARTGPFTFAASATHLAMLDENPEPLLAGSEAITLSKISDGNLCERQCPIKGTVRLWGAPRRTLGVLRPVARSPDPTAHAASRSVRSKSNCSFSQRSSTSATDASFTGP